jgi:hypothetical protein
MANPLPLAEAITTIPAGAHYDAQPTIEPYPLLSPNEG